jgi:hypothetical protein
MLERRASRSRRSQRWAIAIAVLLAVAVLVAEVL